MKHFSISIHTREEVQAFVKLAMVQPFDISVGNEGQCINGKDLMGMFSLDYSRPVRVRVHSTQEEFFTFRSSAAQFLA